MSIFDLPEKLKVETLFMTYYSLAKLYEGQINQNPYAARLQTAKNERLLAKAKGCALDAMQQLSHSSYQGLLAKMRKRREEVIWLEELLSR